MKRRDKIFCAVVALIVIGLVVLVSRKSEELNDSDLYVARRDIPEDQNAYTYIKQAEACMVKSSNYRIYDYGEGTNIVDEQEVVRHIKDNEEAINLIAKAVIYEDCQFPEYNMKTTQLSPLREMARILRIKSEYERRTGNYVQSTDTCITLLKYGALITRNSESIIHYLVGIACLGLAQEQAERIISSRQVQESELRKLLKENQRPDFIRSGLILATKNEYRIACESIDTIKENPRKEMIDYAAYAGGAKKYVFQMWVLMPEYFLDVNRTKLLIANANRLMIRNVSCFYTNAELSAYEIPSHSFVDKANLLIGRNALGKNLYMMLAPTLGGIQKKKSTPECNVAALKIMAACRLYEIKNGKLPDKLDELVPDYLDSVPLDPYDGKPFRYKPEKDMIYSVGKDCVDNGGSTNAPKGSYSSATRWNAEDAVFEIHKK